MRWPVAVSADPLASRPESLKPLLLRASEDGYGDLYRQHLFDQYRLVVEMADRLSECGGAAEILFRRIYKGTSNYRSSARYL
jgi:hypothetical protein